MVTTKTRRPRRRHGEARAEILVALEKADSPLTTKQISDRVGFDAGDYLRKMTDDGKVAVLGTVGQYHTKLYALAKPKENGEGNDDDLATVLAALPRRIEGAEALPT